MKKIVFLVVAVFSCSVNNFYADSGSDSVTVSKPKRFLLDTIDVKIYTAAGDELITRSDVTRPALTGQCVPLENCIQERLVYCDAKKYKVDASDDAIDRYIAMIMRENNMTLADIKRLFESSGYTYEEGKNQLERMQTVKSMIEAKVASKLIVSAQEVEDYWKTHPELHESVYTLQIVLIPFSQHAQQYEELCEQLQSSKEVNSLPWSKAFAVSDTELAQELSCVRTLAPNEISEPRETSQGFQIIRLCHKTTKSVDDYYQEIVMRLKKPKFEALLADYYRQLRDCASIVYCDLVPQPIF